MAHYLVLEHPNRCRICDKPLPKGERVSVEWDEASNHATISCLVCSPIHTSEGVNS